MKIFLAITVALCAVMMACGDSGGGNSALNREFDYGTPTTATADEAGAMDSTVAGLLEIKTGPTYNNSSIINSAQGVVDDLLGSSMLLKAEKLALSVAKRAESKGLRALSLKDFDPDCIIETETKVTFNNCTDTFTEDTVTETITLDGYLSVGGANNQTLTWDVDYKMVMNNTGTSPSSLTVKYHESGTLTVTDTTVVGNMLWELTYSGSSGGQSISFGMAQALVLDLVYQTDPVCVTDGTLEAKRVWTKRPSGATAEQLPDVAVKIEWSACGTAQISASIN
jgi:hypothetical protein